MTPAKKDVSKALENAAFRDYETADSMTAKKNEPVEPVGHYCIFVQGWMDDVEKEDCKLCGLRDDFGL